MARKSSRSKSRSWTVPLWAPPRRPRGKWERGLRTTTPTHRRRVGRLMARMGLVAIQPRSFKPRVTRPMVMSSSYSSISTCFGFIFRLRPTMMLKAAESQEHQTGETASPRAERPGFAGAYPDSR